MHFDLINMFDIITIGSATLDVFLKCNHLHINTHLSEESGESKEMCLPFGKKIEVDDALFDVGGGGTNAAVTLARQNLNVAVIAKIGKDFAGEKVLRELANDKVNTSLLVQDPESGTDFSTILWAPNFGTTILVYRGKSRLETTEIPFDKIQSKWAYISSTEGNLNIIAEIRKLITDIRIAWNPGRKELMQKEKLLATLPNVELLILNRSELTELLGEQQGVDVNSLLSKSTILQCKSLIVTDGHLGSYYFSKDKWLHASAFQVERVETTGAGDAFGSAFVAGKIKGLNDKECLKISAANAASVVTYVGAKRGILKEEQLQNWMIKELVVEELPLV